MLTGSTAGTEGTAAFLVYSASNAAVRNLARFWPLDTNGTGIRVDGHRELTKANVGPSAVASPLATILLERPDDRSYLRCKVIKNLTLLNALCLD